MAALVCVPVLFYLPKPTSPAATAVSPRAAYDLFAARSL